MRCLKPCNLCILFVCFFYKKWGCALWVVEGMQCSKPCNLYIFFVHVFFTSGDETLGCDIWG